MQPYFGWIGWAWLAFYLFWLVMAAFVKKTKVREPVLQRLVYGLSMIVAFLLLVQGQIPSQRTVLVDLFNFAAVPFADRVFTPTATLGVIGLIAAILGLVLAIWARVTLGKNWSGDVTIKQDHTLITAGPYAFVRHPIYTALLLMYLGTWLVLGTLGGIVGFAVLLWGFWIKLRREETFMLKTFPDQYPAYAKRVKRLVPWVM